MIRVVVVRMSPSAPPSAETPSRSDCHTSRATSLLFSRSASLSLSDATKPFSRCAATPKVSDTFPLLLLASRSTSPNTREETPRA